VINNFRQQQLELQHRQLLQELERLRSARETTTSSTSSTNASSINQISKIAANLIQDQAVIMDSNFKHLM
jgi:hypothetical protein